MFVRLPTLREHHGSSAGPCLADGPGCCRPRPRRVGCAPGTRRAMRGDACGEPGRVHRRRRRPTSISGASPGRERSSSPASCSSSFSIAAASTSCSGPAAGCSCPRPCSSRRVRSSPATRSTLMSYGVSQFLGILSALFFVISADAYPARPRVRRGYALVLLAVLFWFALAPMALGAWTVFAPGHVLIAGALAAAGVGHLILLRQVRMLGAAVVGVALLLIAGSHVWVVLRVGEPDGAGNRPARSRFSLVLYLIAALGMQLMTFEDMTLGAAAHEPPARGGAEQAPPHGHHRSADRVPEPPLLRRDHRPRAAAASPLRDSDVGALRRRRSVQGRQRYARPRRGRPRAAGSGGVSPEQYPRGRLRVPVGRRRVPDSAVVRRGGSPPARRGASGRVRALLDRRGAAARGRAEHRQRRGDRRDRRRHGAHQGGRRADVREQALAAPEPTAHRRAREESAACDANAK